MLLSCLAQWCSFLDIDSTDLSKYLASKMSSSITLRFERSSQGRDDLFQEDFSHKRGSSLSARKGFIQSSLKTYRPSIKYIYIHETKEVVWNLPKYLEWSIMQFKMTRGYYTGFPGLFFKWDEWSRYFFSLVNILHQYWFMRWLFQVAQR